MYRGDIDPSAILDIKFTTTAAADGAPTTLAGTPAISVYKDNSTTQSTSGVTLSVDFNSVTGLNNLRVDTSSDGTFYAAGHNFQAVITTGTVGGTSAVGYVVAEFSIQNRSPLRPATAGRTAAIDSSGRVDVGEIAGTSQTARDLGATLGVAGAGLTNLGDARIANLDATITSRTKPADTQAAVTTVATTTNLTNAPTVGDLTATMKASVTTAATAATPTATVSGDFSATMKTSLNAATPASVVGAVGSVTGNVGGNVVGSVGSVTGLTASNLDTTVSSRLATSGYTTPPTANANADALLGRNLAGGSNGGRTVQDALRPSRNKVVIDSGTITVYAEDDTTIAWTGVLTTDPEADPITALDPA